MAVTQLKRRASADRATAPVTLGHSCPPPDLVLVLSAPGPVMYAKKREYSAETLEDWRQHFLALRRKLPQVELVDTTRPVDEVRADAMHRIWRRYPARWRSS